MLSETDAVNVGDIRFDRKDVLGSGGYGSVYRGNYKGQSIAVKRVEKRADRVQFVENELNILKKLDHPNIVKLLHFDSDADFQYFVLEICNTSLEQVFRNRDSREEEGGENSRKDKRPTLPNNFEVFFQLASGLKYIHSQKIIHRDIKPGNILISVKPNDLGEEITIEWADFGLSQAVNERGTFTMSGVRGTLRWFAPEVLEIDGENLRIEETRGNIQSDVFEEGLVFGYILLEGSHIYGQKEEEIVKNIRENRPINMNQIHQLHWAHNLIEQMLTNIPENRITSEEVVAQLQSTRIKISGKEEELLQLCARDSRLDLSEKIKNFIPFGININVKDNDGSNALHLLCRYYSSYELIAAMNLVIQSGIDVNARDYNGLNALHYVCRYNATPNLIDAIQNLIKLGIDPKAKTKDGSNALHYLTRYNSKSDLNSVIKILGNSGIDLWEEDDNGWNMFYYLDIKNKKKMEIWIDREAFLGQGGFGHVLKGKYGGREVAVKRVELRFVNEKEEEALRALDHPNVVKLLHCDSDEDFRMYVLELCDASLDQLFLEPNDPKKYDGPMPRYIHVFLQLASGLKHIHSKLIIHRDIKPQNVLISKTPASRSNEVTIKWADFGLSKSVDERGYHSWSGVRGTEIWYAPEVLEISNNIKEAEEAKKLKGTVKSDVFALGLVFGFLFLKGEHVYGSSDREISDNVITKQPINLKKIDGELLEIYQNNLLQKMFENDPSKRMTSAEVVEQLKSIEDKLAEKEEQLRQLCASPNPRSDITRKIKDLICFGIDVNAKNQFGWNALHLLCRYNSTPQLIEAIKVLIELGIDKDAKQKYGWNALHLLCSENSGPHLIEAIKVLIDLGIDKDAKTNIGSSALHLLCCNNSGPHLIEAIKVLIDLGIDLNAKNNDGWNALHLLCRYNSTPQLIEAIKFLIKLGIDLNAKQKYGLNALHLLCRFNSTPHLIEAIKVLINLGIDKDAKTNIESSALHLLCCNNSGPHLIEAIKVLIDLGINLNAKNNDGWNALHLLCRYNSTPQLIEVIKVLIKLGIDLNAKTNDGSSAVDLSRRNEKLSEHNVDEIFGTI